MDDNRRPIVERRAAIRHSAVLVGRSRIRIRPGHPADLLDIAVSGMCVDTLRRLLPGMAVDLQWERGVGADVYRARVVRCAIVSLSHDRVRYRAGLAFDQVCLDINSLLASGKQLSESTCLHFPDSAPADTRTDSSLSRVHEGGIENY